MRGWFLTLLVVLIAATAAFLLIDLDAGYVLVAYKGQTIEMTVLLALLLLLLIFAAFSFAISFLRGVLGTRRAISGWVKNQQHQQSLGRTTQGLVAFVEGRWEYASKSLERSAKGSETPFVNYLFAARASSALGDTKKVDYFLKQAEDSSVEARVAIGLTQAELQIQSAQYEKALATLLRVRQDSHNHPVAATLLADVYQSLGDWDSLLRLLSGSPAGVFDETEAANLEFKACLALISQSARQGDLEKTLSVWKRLPARSRQRTETIVHYVQSLLAGGHAKEAESVVRNQLQRSFSSEMAELYGLAIGDKPARQFGFAEKQLKSHPSDASLLLTLGRLAQCLDRDDDAFNYFTRSVEYKPSAAAYNELASLSADKGDYQQSAELYAKSVSLRSPAFAVQESQLLLEGEKAS